MRGKSRSKSGQRASKRKNEMESSSTSEPKSKRLSKKNENEQKVDKYCWLCHTESNDKICATCHRVYHNSCLDKASASFSELGVCPECQFMSVDGTELNSNRFLNLDKLKKMLDVLTRRSFDKKRKKNEIFLGWPEEDRDNLFKIIDFEILLDNINHVLPYTRTAEFYGDVKFIYHNSCIAYGANSDQAKAAENLRRDFKAELLDLEACPECYYYLYCDETDNQDPFVRLCECPHDIVWAQLTGHPFWPAKCLKTVHGMAHVRFFGKHEQSNIPISKCLFLSENHPKYKNSNINSQTNSGPKSQSYKCARDELLHYIRLYRRKYGNFPFYPHKTPYKPHEIHHEVAILSTEGSCNRKLAQMKLEGNVNEDSEMCRVVQDLEDTSDILAPNGSGTQGQYPTLEQINPSINPGPSSCEGSITESQYRTFAQLNPGIEPSLSDGQDNLNKNPSAVTSINMTFSSDENNAIPVVTSIGSLPPADIAPSVQSSQPVNVVGYNSKKNEKFKGGQKLPSGPEGTETVHSMSVTNIASNGSPIQSDLSHNIVNNLTIYTGNQTEWEDEVHFIGQQRNVEDPNFNPDEVLPVLMEENPELRTLVQKNRYISDAMTVQIYASCNNNSNNIGKMSKLCVDLRKCKSDLRKALEENDKLRKDDETNKYTIQGLNDTLNRQNDTNNRLNDTNNRLNDTVNKLEADNTELQSKYLKEKEKNVQAALNARIIITGLKKGCSKKIEEMLKTQFDAAINEKEDCILKKDKQLQDAEEVIKNLEEGMRCLKKDMEELKVENQKFQVENQKFQDELKAVKSQISPDTISEYKRTHYCCVCERSAGMTCCLNTSYCSLECEKRHAEEHKKDCRNKIPSQSIVQQSVIRQQSVFMVSHGVISSGRSPMTNPSISEVSDINSETGSSSTHRGNNHHISPPLLPTPRYRSSTSSSSSSSRSYSSKSKRRSCR